MSERGLIVFDLDGTLVDQAAAVERWVDELITAHRLDGELRPWLIAQLTARRPKDQVFTSVARRTGIELGSVALWEQYRAQMPTLVTLFPGVTEALRSLRAAGWKLGIATNGMPDNQVGKLTATGLDALVDGWAVSGEAGFRKPDPRLLSTLAERLDVPLKGWMVGDGLESDIEAGRAAGLRTAWVCADPVPAEPVRADLVVADVAAFAAHVLTR